MSLSYRVAPSLAEFRPVPTATVICSSDGPLTGERNSRAGVRGVLVEVLLDIEDCGQGISRQLGALDDVRARGRLRGGRCLGPFNGGDEREEILGGGELIARRRLRDVGGCRHPDRRAVLGGVRARLSEEPDVLDGLGMVRRDGSKGEGQHRVLGELARRERIEAVVEAGCPEVLLVPALVKSFLQVLETGERCRGVGVLDLVVGVVGGEVRDGRLDVAVVGEDEQLRGPVVRGLVGGADRGDPGGLELVVVGLELGPGRRDRQTVGREDLLVVQDAATHRRATGHAEDPAVLRHRRDEGVGDVGDVRLVRSGRRASATD